MNNPDSNPWFNPVWSRVCAQLRAEMDERYYSYWIGSLEIVSATPESIVISCRSQFRRDQTAEKFGLRIADLIEAQVPNLGKVDFVHDPVVKSAVLPASARRAVAPAVQTPEAAETAVALAGERRVLIEDIKRGVAERYKITVAEMESASRKRALVRPRQIAMLLTRRITHRSFPEIARRFGNRDHTTIIHGCRKIERQIAVDAIMAAEVAALMSQFTGE